MKKVVLIFLLLLFVLLTWLAWLKPASAPTPATVRISLPAQPHSETLQSESAKTLWRVITRRVISQAAVNALTQLLKSMGLEPITIRKQEDVTLHAFDDATLYNSSEEASTASTIWRNHGIETTVIKVQKDVYLIGLGRFYQTHYAEGMQTRLREIGKEFRYQQRTVPIPTWRFTFPPMEKIEADKLWKQLNNSGEIMPVVMPEPRFQELYGKAASP